MIMEQKKKEMQVAALCNGTSIDHIPANEVFKVVSLLGLENLSNPITIGNNLESKKMGSKGIIKITNKFFEENEINKIALIAPNAILNVIKNYEVVDKKKLTLPHKIKGIVACNNPKCITNNEPMLSHFDVIDDVKIKLKCYYCSSEIEKEDIILK